MILLTNDDGIASLGLRAAVEAVLPLGEPWVVAPDRQWSGAGRSMPPGPEGRTHAYPMEVGGREVSAYQVDASPALAVIHGVLELVSRRPSLIISGINYGENLGNDVTVSGTVGAALQGAAYGIPSLAVSLEAPKEVHRSASASLDFDTAIHFTRYFAQRMLETGLPADVDVVKVDIPSDASPETPWRLTRASRYAYYEDVPPEREDLSEPIAIAYNKIARPEETEPDSDIYAFCMDRVVSVTPLSLDLTSRAGFDEIDAALRRTM